MTFPVEPSDRDSQRPATPRRQRRYKRKSRARKGRNIAVVLVGILAVIALAGYGYVRYRYGQIKKLSVQNLTAPVSNQPMNILIVGSNSRAALNGKQASAFGTPQQVGGARSDVTMVLHIDPKTRSVSLVSIPRDLFMPIPGSSLSNRVDASLNAGPSQLVKTVEQDLGISISHYVELNFDTFQSIVQTLGGLDMYFPYPVRDAYSGLNVPNTGCHYLNGFQALAVVRARHLEYQTSSGQWIEDPLGDLSRIRRDHEFMRVLFSAVKAKGISNPLTLNSILSSVAPDRQVDSSFSLGDMISLASKFRSINPNTIPTATLPVALVNNYTYNGANYGDVVFPAQPQDQSVINQYLDVPPPLVKKGSFSISVLNGSGIAQQAAKISQQLTADGFSVASTGNAKILSKDVESIIYYKAGYLQQAELLRNSLSGSVIMGESSTLSQAPVELVAGTTLTVANSQATATTQAPSTTTTSAGSTPTTLVPVTLPATASVTPLQPWDPRACPAGSKVTPVG